MRSLVNSPLASPPLELVELEGVEVFPVTLSAPRLQPVEGDVDSVNAALVALDVRDDNVGNSKRHHYED